MVIKESWVYINHLDEIKLGSGNRHKILTKYKDMTYQKDADVVDF